MLAEGIGTGLLSFSVDVAEAIRDAEIVFLCVPTPQSDDGSADLSYVKAALSEIAPHLSSGAIVVNKSTVPVGSTKEVERALARNDVKVVSNPEFLREGSAIQDFLKPDRVVVGADDRVAAEKVASLYESIRTRVIITDPASAETIKYAANAFLATKLSFINAIAAICEGVGADIDDVALGLGSDKRIGESFLKPGPGWGGSCFPKDSQALLQIARTAGYEFDLLKGVISVNNQQIDRVVNKVRQAVGGNLSGMQVAVWGLTFKAGTDDLRDSPSIAIIARMLSEGAIVVAFDPTVRSPKPGLPELLRTCISPIEATRGADVLVILTEWDELRNVMPSTIASTMNGRTIVDARNLLDRDSWRDAGFTHIGIGR